MPHIETVTPRDHKYIFPAGGPSYSPVNHAYNTGMAINGKGETHIYELYDPSISPGLVEASAEYEYNLRVPSCAPIVEVRKENVRIGSTTMTCGCIVRTGKPGIKEFTGQKALEPLAVLQGMARYIREICLARLDTPLENPVCHGFISPKVLFVDPHSREVSVSGTNIRKLAGLIGEETWWKTSVRPDVYSLAFRTYGRTGIPLSQLTPMDDIWSACMTVLCLVSEAYRNSPLDIVEHDFQTMGAAYAYLDSQCNYARWIERVVSKISCETSRVIITKGLHISPEKRFRSVDEFFDACHKKCPAGGEDISIPSSILPQLEIVKAEIRKYGHGKSPLLIIGPSGSGKSTIVDAIHSFIHRGDRSKPLVKQYCGNFEMTLMNSQLFGHVKGAYTGAVADGTGILDSAGNGTLFLDEIDSLPPDAQVRLFRIFDKDRSYKRIGVNDEKQKISCNCTFILGTNANCRDLVAAGTMRRDFYNRITSFPPIRMLPVIERKDELRKALQKKFDYYRVLLSSTNPQLQLPEKSLEVLLTGKFPENFRSAQNYISKAVCILLQENRNVVTEHDARNIISEVDEGQEFTTPVPPHTHVAKVSVDEILQKLLGIIQENPEAIDRGKVAVAMEWTDENGNIITTPNRAKQILRREIIDPLNKGSIHRPVSINRNDWETLARFCKPRTPGRRPQEPRIVT